MKIAKLHLKQIIREELSKVEATAISFDDVKPECDAILGFIKAEVMTKSSTSSIADALELLMNEFKDGVHQTGD